MPKTLFCGYICGIMTTHQQILMIWDSFEIIFIGALFPPWTAVVSKYVIYGPIYDIYSLIYNICSLIYNIFGPIYEI